jgi:hypothetical protein
MDTQPNEPAKKTSQGEMLKQSTRAGCLWLATFSIAILVVAVIASTMQEFANQRAHCEVESKSNIHNIQLSIERYAVDHHGEYPSYLIGGQGKYSEFIEGDAVPFVNITDCPDRDKLSDPLLREGYIEAYPKNPFARISPATHKFQSDEKDPLRNGTNEAKFHGTRFGPYCTQMGNVMADKRYTEFTITDSKGLKHTYPTFADVAYPCSDMWKKRRPIAYLPGDFFYRTRSANVVENGVEREVIQDYMLGVYGSIHNKGKDVIGPDPTGENLVTPFGASPKGHGNPNGIRDGIILVLTPGKETKGRE